MREETLLERQKQLGVVPKDAKLSPKPKDIKDWDTLTADEKNRVARQMEVFAAFAEHVDCEIGRLVQVIEDLGAMDNTRFFYDQSGEPDGIRPKFSCQPAIPSRYL